MEKPTQAEMFEERLDLSNDEWGELDGALADLQDRSRGLQLRRSPVVPDDQVDRWMYIAEGYPLLESDEATKLARIMELGRRAKEVSSEGFSTTNVIRVMERAEQAKEQFTMSNLHLAISYGMRYAHTVKQGAGTLIEHLYSEGISNAVERFDPSKGYEFSTYAMHWLKHSKNRFFAGDTGRVVALKHDVYVKARALLRLDSGAHEYEHGIKKDEWNDNSAQAALGVGESEFRRIKATAQFIKGTDSLDAPLKDRQGGDDTELVDLLSLSGEGFEGDIVGSGIERALYRAMGSMEETERDLFVSKYIDGQSTTDQLERLGVSKASANYRLRRARSRLIAELAVDAITDNSDLSEWRVQRMRDIVLPHYGGKQDGSLADFIQNTRPEWRQAMHFEGFFGKKAVDAALKRTADLKPGNNVEEMIEYRLWRRTNWESHYKKSIAKLAAREVCAEFDVFFAFTAEEAGMLDERSGLVF